MLTQVEETITELHSHANAKSGFTAKLVNPAPVEESSAFLFDHCRPTDDSFDA
jgi:hypothetical protein